MRGAKSRLKDLAAERVQILMENALLNAKEKMDLAQRQAAIARRICEKVNLRLPYWLRQHFCRGCKRLIVPGINARVRVSGKPKAVRITCLECGHTYRKILADKPKA